MEITGKYGSAIIYNDFVEPEAISQVISLLNHPASESANVRVMPDIHSGAGCVIGYTAKLTSKVIPNLIGVDIGCSILGYNLGKRSDIKLKFDKLDNFVRENIPSGGGKVNSQIDIQYLSEMLSLLKDKTYTHWDLFQQEIKSACVLTGQKSDYVFASIGSLGSGNHFLSAEVDNNDYVWFLIHSGSRNFGKNIAEYHQSIAEQNNLTIPKDEFDRRVDEIKKSKKGKSIEYAIMALKKECKNKSSTGLEYLEGTLADAYFHDMKLAQVYARANRLAMMHKIVGFYKQDFDTSKIIETVHNYINFDDGFIRKGAVSAHDGEMLFIPMNMEYGTLLCKGKGNPEWNHSAPHGAGRLMSRSKAKETITLERYQETMKRSGVWTSCVGKGTLDEAPQAYKNPEEIIRYIEPTADIISRLVPIYNFKAE